MRATGAQIFNFGFDPVVVRAAKDDNVGTLVQGSVNTGGYFLLITFAEQSSPDSFAADPNFYPAFIQKLGGYDTFNSVNGQVDLTRPAQVNAETGVMNTKGTLLFARSDGDLSETNWKLLFNSLDYTQPN